MRKVYKAKANPRTRLYIVNYGPDGRHLIETKIFPLLRDAKAFYNQVAELGKAAELLSFKQEYYLEDKKRLADNFKELEGKPLRHARV